MDMKDKVAIITDDNIAGLSELYGKLNIEDLCRIVNKHIAVAIQEIKEDLQKKFNGGNE